MNLTITLCLATLALIALAIVVLMRRGRSGKDRPQ